jgi:soluble lytic murein transglycosylase-like protein
VGALRLLSLAAALAWATPAAARTVADWRPYVVEASERFGVPIAWIEAVMRAESRGRTHLNGRPIRSSAGAMGLMQLMPATWAEMRSRLGLGRNPDEPRDNILAGTFYLRLRYEKFGYPGLFGAYNAGPARYAEHLSGRRSLPRETVGYLASVAPQAGQMPSRQVAIAVPVMPARAPVIGMFVIRKEPPVEVASSAKAAVPSSLFVTLSRDK